MLCVLFACGTKKTNKVILKGEFLNYKTQSFLLKVGDKIDTVFVKKDGRFEKELSLEKNTIVFFKADKLAGQLYLMPGSNLEISHDMNKPKQPVNFVNNNSCSAINKYIVEKYELEGLLKIDKGTYYSMSETDFIVKTTNDYDRKNDLLNKLLKEVDNIDPTFIEAEKAQLKYQKLLNYLSYEGFHKRYTQNRDFVASDVLKDLLKEEELNKAGLMEVAIYRNYLKKRLDNLIHTYYYKEHTELKTVKNGYSTAQITVLEKNFSDAKVMSYLIYRITQNRLKSGIIGAEPLLAKFKEYCKNSEYIKTVDNEVAKWSRLNPGKLAPDFAGQTVDGKTISLSDLKGKYVYVDVWATWCGPCCGEIPFLQKLEKEYHGKNIVFLSVSVDKDLAKWKKKVEDDKLGGIQINVGSRSSVSKDYMINGIPRFMLFDPEGKIVSTSTSRPSGKIREIFSELKGL
jgi:thiol-disulfide isomerase/thioredoxin